MYAFNSVPWKLIDKALWEKQVLSHIHGGDADVVFGGQDPHRRWQQ